MGLRTQVRRISGSGRKKNGKIRLLSRNLKRLEHHFPELLGPLARLPAATFLLDGEIVMFDAQGRSRFQMLQQRIGFKYGRSEAPETPACYMAFDLIECDGFDLRGVTWAERRRVLEALLPPSESVKSVEVVAGQGQQFYDLVVGEELEGIVAKQSSSPYVSGRSPHWQKVKSTREESFVVGGLTPPSGGRKRFGALLLGHFEGDRLRLLGRVGGGFKDEQLEEIYRQAAPLRVEQSPFIETPRELADSVWLKPDLVCDVRFSEWTEGGLLRAPVFLRMRPDREARECVLRVQAPQDPGVDIQTELEQYDFLSNLDKPFWPEEGYLKRDLVEYYHRIAPVLLPYLKDRPMNLERYPDGYAGKSFYQKDAPDFLPEWIETALIESESKGKKANRYVVCNDRPTLVYLANLACIPLHPWSSRVGSIEYPDFLIVDLDPAPDVPFGVVCRFALRVREVLLQLGLESFAKTSGSKGLHVVVPLSPEHDYPSVRRFAEVVARLSIQGQEEIATLERNLEKRKGKIYVDYLQNGLGKTIVSPYCLRPRPGAPVSTPLQWNEVSSSIRPQAFNIRSLFRRLESRGDPYAPMLTVRQSLREALQKLEELLSDSGS